jgi:integrase/recombinase XerD
MEQKIFQQYLIAKGYSSRSTHTIAKASERFTQWLTQSNTQIETINYNDVTAYLQYLQQRNIKTSSVQYELTHVKHYLNYLVKNKTITHNPALALKIKNSKHKTVSQTLTPEELEKIYKSYITEQKKNLISPPQELNNLAKKRNKVLIGLLIWQGITAEDITNIELKHLELREGNITIPGTRRSNERTLKLEPHQIFELFDYINETRKAILKATGKKTNQLIISTGSSSNIQNTLQRLFQELRKSNPLIKNLDQVRASVITNWLKHYNKRKVQYMAGHRYVSSTERYEANNIEALQEDVEKYYPTFL